MKVTFIIQGMQEHNYTKEIISSNSHADIVRPFLFVLQQIKEKSERVPLLAFCSSHL